MHSVKVIHPNELVAEVCLDDYQISQDQVDGEEPLRQDVGVSLMGDVAPASELFQHASQGPTNGAVDIENFWRGSVGFARLASTWPRMMATKIATWR